MSERLEYVLTSLSLWLQELAVLPEFEKAVEFAAYEASRVPRVLKQLALLMQNELQSLVLGSLRAYLELIRQYSTPQVCNRTASYCSSLVPEPLFRCFCTYRMSWRRRARSG